MLPELFKNVAYWINQMTVNFAKVLFLIYIMYKYLLFSQYNINVLV